MSGRILVPFAPMSTVESTVEASDDRASSLLAPFEAAVARATSDLEALRSLELDVARAVDTLRALRDPGPDLAAYAAFAAFGAPGPHASRSVDHDELGPADRFVARVTELSLAAQDRGEALLADLRQRPLAQRLPQNFLDTLANARDGIVRSGSSLQRSILRGRAAVDVARRAGEDSIELLAARPQLRRSAVLVLRAGVTVTLAGVLAVQVLGLGRPSSGEQLAHDATSALATSATSAASAATPVEPAPRAPAAPTPNAPGTAAPAPQPAVPAARIAPPIGLRVPAIEVDAPVVIVGLEPDGAMEIPADVRTVGWYEPFPGVGVIPGERGTAVIAGHVDSRVQGRGAFWPLRELRPGDVVEVLHEDGTASRWRVDDVVRYPKIDIPIEDIFTFDGDERLALITCGGEFDRSLGAYLDNYVVTASPLVANLGAGGQLPPASP